MERARIATERDMLPKVGPAFFRYGEVVLFQFVIDTGNIFGPRPATRADQLNHPVAWSAFAAADGVSSLDRDAKGGDGGSLPAESPAVAVEAVRPPVTVPFDEAIPPDYVPPPEVTPEPKPKRKYTRRKKG
jgi:hypothetical protein